jgi:crotonobetainyl-CoA:carnitine CoA-transferase CaiB-like acyl-CoA transferase
MMRAIIVPAAQSKEDTRMGSKPVPLKGVRALNLGGGWVGRIAAMLLGDRGADVPEIDSSDRESRFEDPLLTRGKEVTSLDLTNPDERALLLSRRADIVFDNLAACWRPEALRRSSS